MAKLGEVCKVSASTKMIDKSKAWLLNLDMVEQQTGRVVEYNFVGEDGLNGSITQFDTENVLYSKLRPNLNKVVLPERDGFCTSELLPLRPDARKLDRSYLAVFLRSDGFVNWAVSKTAGAKMPRLGTKDLLNANIPLPEIKEQKAIAEKFKESEELISLRKQQLTKLDELVKARFVEMFGDPISNPFGFKVESLQEMLDDNAITYHLDGNHGSDYPRNEEFVESGVSYISANCIIDDNVNLQLAKHLTEERAAKLRKGIAQDEDVLFAHNATVGPVAILHTRETKVVLGTSLTAYRCNKQRILPSYLKAYMQSEGFVRQYTKDMKQTTRNQVPITAQRKYLFIVPPLSLQNRFASFVERIDQQKQTVQQSLEKLEVMKKALMQEYFG